jgi:methylated-DNA-[protein]-cysteine S-methyltransferase
MNQIDIQFYKTKIGDLILGSFDEKLCLLDFRYRKMRKAVDTRIKNGLNAEFVENNNETIKQAKNQLDEYLNSDRKTFNLPLLMVGTEFQKNVWKSLIKVPYGATSTYLQLAKDISNEKAVRAVASANGANSIGLIVPCHRIIGSDGQLVGYGGGLSVKKRLLNLEQKNSCLTESEDTNHNNNMQPTQKSFAFSVG